ncbi:MAG: dipeptidase [Lachnospiraceae bacterium]
MKAVDMHCDTITELWDRQKEGKQEDLLHNSLQIDLEKLQAGDYMLQNFAMFVHLKRHSDPFEAFMKYSDLFYREIEKHASCIGVVSCFRDIEKNRKQGKLSAMLTVEEGGVCKGSLELLRSLYRMGVRMMTLVWNYENELGFPNCTEEPEDSGQFRFYPETKRGLKERGFVFLEEMERLGMIIDVSHLSDAGFYDVLQNTKKPFVASHSNARALCGHSRNLDDDMIRALAQRGGVIGLNYNADFLAERKEQETLCRSTVRKMAEHVRHLVNTGGVDCVGLGSDFDGITGGPELTDCSKLPLLEEELRRQGFHESEIEAVFYKNVLRVYKELL